MPTFDLQNITPISLEDLDSENNETRQPKQNKNLDTNAETSFDLNKIDSDKFNNLDFKHFKLVNNQFNVNQNNDNVLHDQDYLQPEIDTSNNSFLNDSKEDYSNSNKNYAPQKETSKTDINEYKKVSKRKKEAKEQEFKESLTIDRGEDLLLSIKECETLTGISSVSIRKALKDKEIDYTIENKQYRISFEELLRWCYSSTRRKNVLNTKGIGKYVNEWKKY